MSLLLATLLGGSLSAGGANAINCYIDRDIDQVMRDQADLVEVVHELRGVLSYKGVEPQRERRRGRTVVKASAENPDPPGATSSEAG